MSPSTTLAQTDMAPTSASGMAPMTTVGDASSTTAAGDDTITSTDGKVTTTMSTTSKDFISTTSMTIASTTGTLDEDDYQAPTSVQSATTDLIPEDKKYTPVAEIDIKMIINITLFYCTYSVPHCSTDMYTTAICTRKKGNKKPKSKNELSKMEEFTTYIGPTRTFYTYTSPIYNPYFSEEKDDSYAQ